MDLKLKRFIPSRGWVWVILALICFVFQLSLLYQRVYLARPWDAFFIFLIVYYAILSITFCVKAYRTFERQEKDRDETASGN